MRGIKGSTAPQPNDGRRVSLALAVPRAFGGFDWSLRQGQSLPGEWFGSRGSHTPATNHQAELLLRAAEAAGLVQHGVDSSAGARVGVVWEQATHESGRWAAGSARAGRALRELRCSGGSFV